MAKLTVRGATAHNLKHIDVNLPLGQWIALTGPSGSGKTTLAHDVIHQEGQRRYLGSLSAKARHALGKLGWAQVDELRGLPVTVATGHRSLTPHARSTVGTLSGLLDLLRLFYARAGAHPGVSLTRSHFSFNQELGACAACRGLGVEDLVDSELLVSDPARSIREGALKPTLPNGYTVYSQVTLEVMNAICQAHGFDVDTPWRELTVTQRNVIFHGTTALTVPFGKHSIESRMKWRGITARPREEGHYRGLIPVIEETLKRDRNPNILRFVRSIPCTTCAGSRLGPVGRAVYIGEHTLPHLLARPVRELPNLLDGLPTSPVLNALRPGLNRRLRRMVQLALGHLSLDRTSTTLSAGEGQRLRLLAQLNGSLAGQLLIFDEPTLGLHPSAQAGMAAILEELRGLGNTLLVVDHDPHMVQRADHWLALGPGAGPHGGTIVHTGPMHTGAVQHIFPATVPKQVPHSAADDAHLALRGATMHNLKEVDLRLPLRALTVVSGPSGAGKSSLVFQTLLPALQGKPGGAYRSLEGVPEGMRTQWVDAKPLGRTPRSTPATYTGVFDLVRKRFAALPTAKAHGLGIKHFSYNTTAGRCPTCKGLGIERVGLHLLADVEQPCATCAGTRYAPAVLDIKLQGADIGAVLDMTVDEASQFFANDPPVHRLCLALAQLGLGYLHLGQASNTLSRGEAQRVKLATLLGKAPGAGSLILLDEPDRGLHPDDLVRLIRCLEELVRAGHTVLAISHHPMLWHAVQHRVALQNGRLVSPSPAPSPPRLPRRTPGSLPASIELRGVRTHNLKNLDIRIPHGQITAITGVSGSGKSSLAHDTLAAASWSRFIESLPFQVRRFLRHQPAPDLDSATGLTPVLALRQGQGEPGPRATVGTLTELDAGLRLLWSRLGQFRGKHTSLSAGHFSSNQSVGACPACAGRGTQMRCEPSRLITQPSKPLDQGAMTDSKPGAFFGDPEGQYMQTLQVAAQQAGIDVCGPFEGLSPEAQDLALRGAGDKVFDVAWEYRRGKRTGTHTFRGTWPGLCALVEKEAQVRAKRKHAADWSAPLAPVVCAACQGERLHPDARQVKVAGLRLPTASALELSSLTDTLRDLHLPTSHSATDKAVLDAIRPGVLKQLDTLKELGLGHLTLDRPAATLSTGELQRLRLAGVLDSELTQLTLVLDEPGTGLDSARLEQLLQRLGCFCEQGNTVVMVCHRRTLIEGADNVLTLGPGAGNAGGQLVSQSAPIEMPLAPPLPSTTKVRIEGANAHTLQGFDLELPAQGLVAITGPSGSGKSTLLLEVLAASAQAAKAKGCARATGVDQFEAVTTSRLQARRAPLTTLGLLKDVQALFASVQSDIPRKAFSFHSPAGRCPTCKGSGTTQVPMDFMADLSLDCTTCGGQRYKPAVLQVPWKGMNIAAFLAAPVDQLAPVLPPGRLADAAAALCRIGLGHLNLGRKAHTLSEGEHQRVLLARTLLAPAGPSLFALDEPGTGLHAQDLARLVEVLHALAARAH